MARSSASRVGKANQATVVAGTAVAAKLRWYGMPNWQKCAADPVH
jgi:hypothetical protein